jgi:ABC-2 type transport system permease protein
MATASGAHDASTPENVHGSRSQVLQVARFEFLRQLRRRRMVVMVGIAAALPVTLFLVLQYEGVTADTSYGYASTYVTFVTILAALAATLFGADTLVGEFEQKTGYLLFPQPVSRTSVFLGKLLTAFTLSALTITVYYAILAGATQYVAGGLPIELSYSFLLALLYTTAALGVALFLSSALRTTTMASVLTFALLLFVLTILTQVLMFAGIRPDGSLSFAGGTIGDILTGPYPSAYPTDTVIRVMRRTRTEYVPAVGTSIAIMAAWVVVTVVLALLLFRRREMKG